MKRLFTALFFGVASFGAILFLGCATSNYRNFSKSVSDSDKIEINRLLDDMSIIIEGRRFDDWLIYIDEDSKKYWSDPQNLKKAQDKIPIKGLNIKSLKDYFKYVFVPARRNHNVHEIRCISENRAKAVERYGNKDLIIYYLRKNSGRWQVTIPQL